MKKPTLFRGVSELLTLEGALQKEGRHIQESDLGLIKKAAFIVEDGKIQWIGEDKKIPRSLKAAKEIHLGGAQVLPGWVECHTHTVFAGDRSNEFEMRNRGVSYAEINQKGGGILSTVRATREASTSELRKLAQTRVDQFVQQGVTTLEIKTGYALNLKDEWRCLKVINSLEGPQIIPTFLGAHAKPPEFQTHAEYLDFLKNDVLPKLKKEKLANRVDVFVEKGFFEKEDSRKYLQKAVDLGLQITIHADQLNLSGGTELAIDLKGLSADHCLKLDANMIKKVAKSSVTCVLLPAADFYLQIPYPPARDLISNGARVALATDFNPGTSPTQDLSLVGLLARLEMKMSLSEVIASYTVGAAFALGLEKQKGAMLAQMSADFNVLNGEWRELFYSVGQKMVSQTYREGRLLQESGKLASAKKLRV